MAGEKDLTAEQKRTEMAELMWLNYFNQTLYEKGLICEVAHSKIKLRTAITSQFRWNDMQVLPQRTIHTNFADGQTMATERKSLSSPESGFPFPELTKRRESK